MKKLLFLLFTFITISTSFGQHDFKSPEIDTSSICNFIVDVDRGKWLDIKNVEITPSELCTSLKHCLSINESDELVITGSKSFDSIETRYSVQQFHNDIAIEGAEAYFFSLGKNVYRIKQSFVKNSDVSNSILISDSNSIALVLQRRFPELEYSFSDATILNKLVLYKLVGSELKYCWKSIVLFPNLRNSKLVYIDAETGDILLERDYMHFCSSGTGTTAHHGTQTIHTKFVSSALGYRLYDDCSHTYHTAILHTIEDAPNPEYYDADNNWTSSGDIPGVQTHWAAHHVLNYYGSYWGRNSFNNAGDTLVCHNYTLPQSGNNNAGAFYNPYNDRLYLGTDGVSNYDNWNTLDIIGHEFTHAVISHEGDLNYNGESGALNESFSDIMGVAFERWVIGTVDWFIGEDRGSPLRSLSQPNSYGEHFTSNSCTNCSTCTRATGQPDTYQGTYWYTGSCDNGGVHINSGVQNYWFYLLTNGGSGTNDLGNSYNVTGISFSDAIAIVYRNITHEVGGSDNYSDARQGSINAATYLFGANSQQVCAVKQAWYAVGVGTNCTTSTTCSTPTGTTETSIGQTSSSLDWSSVSSALSYTVRYRVSGTSTWSYSYPTSSAASLTNLSCNTSYEWQVRADCSGGNSSSYTTTRTFTTNSCGGTINGDNCSQAIPISSSNSCSPTISSVANMTSSGISIPTCSGSTSSTALDIWFVFQAQATTHTILVDPEGTYSGTSNNNYVDPVIAIYSSCSSSAFIQCEDDAGGGGGNCDMVVSGLTIGSYYYIRVFDYGSSQPTYGGFDICVTHSGGTTTCATPNNTTENSIGTDYADLDWSNASGANYYEVRYRVSGGSWNYEYPSNSSQSIYGLQCNTTYEWQVRTVCSSGNSNYSSTRTFTTSPCLTPCNTPSGTTEIAIGTDYADLDWSNISTSNYYEVRYRASGGSWNYEYPSNSSQSIYGLQCNTTYEWQVRTVCSSGNSNYSSTRTFTTSPCSTPCNTPSGTTETAIGTDYADLDWSNVSGANYYEVRYRIFGGSWSYLSPTSSLQSVYGLQCNTTYEWQVRTFCSSSNSSYSSTRTFTTFTCSTPCNSPSGSTETAIGTDYADLDWSNVSGANYYEVRYRISGGSWNYEYPSNSSQSIYGLQCNTTYEWQVRTICSNGNSSYSSSRIFTTPTCSTPCNTPTGTTESAIGTDYADLDWSNVSGANYYEVRYRVSGGVWNYQYPSNSAQSIYGLQCNTTYEWQVKSVCSSNNSNYSTSRTFTTSSCCPSGVPSLNFPQSGTTMYGNNITFTWTAVANATNYLFEISRDVYFLNIDYTTQNGFNVSGNNVSLSLQQFSQDGTTYYWRVKALGNSCNSSFSSISNFKSGSCSGTYPPTPLLYNPPYASTQYGDTIYFNWSNISCVYEYQIQLSNASVFNSNTIVGDYTSSYFSVYFFWNNPLPAGLVYYWRVRSRNNYGWSSWSNNYYFITGGPTGIIDLSNDESRFILYPNPNNGYFNCIFTNNTGINYKFSILNATGQVVYVKNGFTSADITETFNLESISSGLYFIHLNYGDKHIVKKFTKY